MAKPIYETVLEVMQQNFPQLVYGFVQFTERSLIIATLFLSQTLLSGPKAIAQSISQEIIIENQETGSFVGYPETMPQPMESNLVTAILEKSTPKVDNLSPTTVNSSIGSASTPSSSTSALVFESKKDLDSTTTNH